MVILEDNSVSNYRSEENFHPYNHILKLGESDEQIEDVFPNFNAKS